MTAGIGQDKAEREDNVSEEEEDLAKWKDLNFPWFFRPEGQNFNPQQWPMSDVNVKVSLQVF
jgi:hypothetical protein